MCNSAFCCWARKEEAARLYVVNRHLSKVKKKVVEASSAK